MHLNQHRNKQTAQSPRSHIQEDELTGSMLRADRDKQAIGTKISFRVYLAANKAFRVTLINPNGRIKGRSLEEVNRNTILGIVLWRPRQILRRTGNLCDTARMWHGWGNSPGRRPRLNKIRHRMPAHDEPQARGGRPQQRQARAELLLKPSGHA